MFRTAAFAALAVSLLAAPALAQPDGEQLFTQQCGLCHNDETMGPTLAAREQHKVDQVLFCPGGSVQETGAANFLLIREGHILTRSLEPSFLHGVTRDSLLQMAPDLGYQVEERVFTVDEMLDWVKTG
mgnify:CR=1 FL=1